MILLTHFVIILENSTLKIISESRINYNKNEYTYLIKTFKVSEFRLDKTYTVSLGKQVSITLIYELSEIPNIKCQNK